MGLSGGGSGGGGAEAGGGGGGGGGGAPDIMVAFLCGGFVGGSCGWRPGRTLGDRSLLRSGGYDGELRNLATTVVTVVYFWLTKVPILY